MEESSAPWTLLTGDNATGKTTLLKAIALSLCDRSSAAGLLRESDSGYIRHGQDSATIEIHLLDRQEGRPDERYQIKTTLTRLNHQLESLDQETEPSSQFPLGTHFRLWLRSRPRYLGHWRHSRLLGYQRSVQPVQLQRGIANPELTIRRLRARIAKARKRAHDIRRDSRLRRCPSCRKRDERSGHHRYGPS